MTACEMFAPITPHKPLAFIGTPRREMLRTKLDLRCRGVSITRFEGASPALGDGRGPYGESNLTGCVKRSSSTWISGVLESASLIMTTLCYCRFFDERRSLSADTRSVRRRRRLRSKRRRLYGSSVVVKSISRRSARLISTCGSRACLRPGPR